MRSRGAALATLFVTLFFIQAAFHVYNGTLPLHLEALGFDPSLIGVLVGAAAAAQILGSLLVGPAIDRFGGRRLLVGGALCYLVASFGFLWLQSAPALAGLRVLQGLGIAAVVPSMYSFVPSLAPVHRHTIAFAAVGASSNASMAVGPPVGMALYQLGGGTAFFLASALAALVGLGLAQLVPAPPTSRRPFSLTFRRAWLPPLLVGILSVIQFGVLVAFLPLEAVHAGANPALFFAADAVAVLASRIPAGWLADRYGALPVTLLGIAVTTAAALLPLLPLDDTLMVAAGVLNGIGGGIVLPPMLAQLSRRSDDRTRGTALAYFSMSFAVGLLIGSGVGGLLFGILGFHGLLVAAALLCAAASLVALADRATVALEHAPGRV